MKKFLPVFLFLFLVLPLIVSADTDPQTIICNLLNTIKTIIAAIGFGVGVIMLVIGGIQYMTAGGDPEKSKKAQKLMINAMVGIAIVFGAVFILALVQGLLSGAGISLLRNNCTF